MKDKETRQSKGVAFALFLNQKGAHTAVNALHNKEVQTAWQLHSVSAFRFCMQLFGRTLKCSVAKDNGRTPEFIRRKTYPDKSRCYECGEFGHLSYQCPKNAFGDRDLPEKKPKKRRRSQQPKQ
jgi:U11/U12 small nuclear ribonucleoprotein SNRNP31